MTRKGQAGQPQDQSHRNLTPGFKSEILVRGFEAFRPRAHDAQSALHSQSWKRDAYTQLGAFLGFKFLASAFVGIPTAIFQEAMPWLVLPLPTESISSDYLTSLPSV